MRLLLLLPLVALLAAACNSERKAKVTTGALAITAVPAPGGDYIEGFRWIVRGQRIGGPGEFSRPARGAQIPPDPYFSGPTTRINPVVVTVPAGRYRLAVQHLAYPAFGPPDTCTGQVVVAAGKRTELVVETRSARRCTIRPL